jgi:hypothetical protein
VYSVFQQNNFPAIILVLAFAFPFLPVQVSPLGNKVFFEASKHIPQ